MAQRSGFFNALLTNGQYDRKYNADDYSENLAAIISTGVRRSGDNDLYVQVAGGMSLKVNVGRAWINGKWYVNDTVFTDFIVPTAPTGDRGRVDRIVLRLNKNIEGRLIELVYLTGTAGQSPTAPALTRNESIYEIALADIAVRPNVTTITQSDIYDRRSHSDVCGWVTSPVGYEDYFKNFDVAFEEWFGNVKDTLASTTLFKEYHWRTTTNAETSAVTFNIPQYDPTGVDILKVYVNGILEIAGTDYTANGSVITFVNPKIAGTDVDVFVYKSIDGTGLRNVSDEITDLQNQMATVKNIGEYIYLCNGVDDNWKLSQLAETFFADSDLPDDAQMTINVYGTMGISAPYSGQGTSVSRFRWFSVGTSSATSKRRITIDFLNASPINLTGTGENYYICFFGGNLTIKNAVIIARQRGSTTAGSVQVFVNTAGEAVLADHCKFDVSAYYDSYIASKGTFRDCDGTVTNSRSNSYCFAADNGLIRVFGGNYTAYTGLTNTFSAVFGEVSSKTGVATVFAMGVNCPTLAKASHYQTNAAKFTTTNTYGLLATISALSVSLASGGKVTSLYNSGTSHPEEIF